MAVKRRRKTASKSTKTATKTAIKKKTHPGLKAHDHVVSLVSSSSSDDEQPTMNGPANDASTATDDAKVVLDILLAAAAQQSIPLTKEAARLLVETTRDQHAAQHDVRNVGDAGNVGDVGDVVDVNAWAEACMVAMAIDNEIDHEAAEVRVAMEDSLREAETARAKPLADEPPEIILEHYNKFNSQVAGFLIETDRATALERLDLHDLLDLETRCAKWYGSASVSYFKDLVDGLRAAERTGAGVETEGEAVRAAKAARTQDVSRALLGTLQAIRQAVLVESREDFFAAYETNEPISLIL